MYSLAIYAFCAGVSLWAGAYFQRVWRTGRNESHREFSEFFFTLALGFVLYLLSPVLPVSVAGVAAQLGLFAIVLSFAFVLRAFVRFESLTVSPNAASMLVFLLIGMKLVVSVAFWFPELPFRKAFLVLQYPFVDSLVFSALVFLFAAAMAHALVSHLERVRAHQRAVSFLATAFFVGGASGVVLPNASGLAALTVGYAFLVLAFVCTILFLLSVSHR